MGEGVKGTGAAIAVAATIVGGAALHHSGLLMEASLNSGTGIAELGASAWRPAAKTLDLSILHGSESAATSLSETATWNFSDDHPKIDLVPNRQAVAPISMPRPYVSDLFLPKYNDSDGAVIDHLTDSAKSDIIDTLRNKGESITDQGNCSSRLATGCLTGLGPAAGVWA